MSHLHCSTSILPRAFHDRTFISEVVLDCRYDFRKSQRGVVRYAIGVGLPDGNAGAKTVD